MVDTSSIPVALIVVVGFMAIVLVAVIIKLTNKNK